MESIARGMERLTPGALGAHFLQFGGAWTSTALAYLN